MRLARSISLVTAIPVAILGASSVASAQSATKLKEAATKTTTATTMQFESNIVMKMNLAGQKVNATITAKGQVDRAKKASSIEMDLSAFMKSVMGASGSSASLPPQMKDPANFRIKIVSQDTKVWMSYPFLSLMAGGKAIKPWVLIDAATLGVDAGDLAAGQGVDPTQGLEMLAGLSDKATAVGKETVKGVATTHYRGTVSLTEFTKTMPAAQVAEMKRLLGANVSMPVDVWIDGDSQVRRMDTTFSTEQGGMKMDMVSQYFFFKFGEPVSITAPPSSQVGSLAQNPMLEQVIKQQSALKKAA